MTILSLFNATYIAELVAFIASLFLLNKATGIWRLFIPFLLLTLITETVGWYYHVYLNDSNNWIYNILLIISIPLYLFVLSLAKPLVKVKRPIMFILAAFLFLALLNVTFFEGLLTYNGYTEVLGGIITIMLSCYFIYLALTEEGHRDLFRYEYFWFANGLLFYCLGSIVLYAFLDSIRQYYVQTHINMYAYINGGLNILLYGSFIIAFICRRRTTRLLLA